MTTDNKKTTEQQKIAELLKGMWASMVIGVIFGVFAGIFICVGAIGGYGSPGKYIYFGAGAALAIVVPLLWRKSLKKVMARYKTVDEMLKDTKTGIFGRGTAKKG